VVLRDSPSALACMVIECMPDAIKASLISATLQACLLFFSPKLRQSVAITDPSFGVTAVLTRHC
jgi:hypothetical protein